MEKLVAGGSVTNRAAWSCLFSKRGLSTLTPYIELMKVCVSAIFISFGYESVKVWRVTAIVQSFKISPFVILYNL